MKILLIGPQGSGKSTQAKLLGEYLNIPAISTGDIFRKLVQEESPIAGRLKDILNEGRLVDDETTSEIVKQRLKQEDVRGGFIMDGYPRNIEQVRLFDPVFDQAFYLQVPDEEVTKRLMARGREDDTIEGIKTRLGLYLEQTKPLLEFYKNQGILTEIDGVGSVEEIFVEIRKNLKA